MDNAERLLKGWVEGALAKDAYTDNTFRVQGYMPLADRRELTEEEREDVDKAQQRLLPKFFVSKGDSITSRMFAPRTSAALGAIGAGAAGAGLGGIIGGAIGSARAMRSYDARELQAWISALGNSDRGSLSPNSVSLKDAYDRVVREGTFSGARVGAVAGVLALSTVGAVLAYKARQKTNKDLEDRMRRLPEESTTIRDMESDPVYQKDMDRKHALGRAAILSTALAYR